jgi:hypothetical protein
MADMSDHASASNDNASIKSPDAEIYVNAFTIGTSLSDVYIIMSRSRGEANAVVQMSFTTAKTLMENLTQVINEFEEKTGQTILTMKDVQDRCFPEEAK